MSELAFNINGEAFEVPAHATGWRVRRMRAKGSPEVVYARDGVPLVLPIDAELDDLRTEVAVSGRYRLDLVDQNNKSIADVPSGYVQVNLEAPPTSGSTGASLLPNRPSDNVVIEAMRTQAAMSMSVIERFPLMMDSAATLLRAADGAGLPARAPRDLQLDEHETDEGDETAPTAAPFDLNALIAQLVPVLVTSLASGQNKVPGLAELLDWRKASSVKVKAKPKAVTPAQPSEIVVPENAMDVLPPIDPQTMAHFIAVQSALTSEEAAIAREVAGELTASELRAWFDELSKLAVPDAVAKVRKLIAGKHGGAS